MAFGYGGLVLGYAQNRTHRLYWDGTLLVGAGALTFDHNHPGVDKTNPVFVLEPGLTGHIKATTTLMLGIGVDYRFLFGADLPGCLAIIFGSNNRYYREEPSHIFTTKSPPSSLAR